MKQNGMPLARHTGRSTGRVHDGKVVMRSNLRWCSDGFEIAWLGTARSSASPSSSIDAPDREIIAWHAVAGSGISGGMVGDMMLEAAEARFATLRAPPPLEWRTDNGSATTARKTRDFAAALHLVPGLPPVRSPKPNGICKSFVKTFKRDQARVNPSPDAAAALRQIAGWCEDDNDNHPHSALRMLPKGVHPSPSASRTRT